MTTTRRPAAVNRVLSGIEPCLGVFHRGKGTGEGIPGRRLNGLACQGVTSRQFMLWPFAGRPAGQLVTDRARCHPPSLVHDQHVGASQASLASGWARGKIVVQIS